MKKPTLEEVKEYFKNAETVLTLGQKEIEIDIDSMHCICGDIWSISKSGYFGIVYGDNGQYAKILTYKKPKYQITKEQILKYQMKDEFSDVFKSELESGRWYYQDTYGKTIFNITGIEVDIVHAYGFDYKGIYREDSEWFNVNDNKNGNIRLATTEEVTEALKKEAVRRYKKGDYISDLGLFLLCDCDMIFDDKFFQMDSNGVFCAKSKNGYWMPLMRNGQWTTVIPTKTKEEAEKLLNCKIV